MVEGKLLCFTYDDATGILTIDGEKQESACEPEHTKARVITLRDGIPDEISEKDFPTELFYERFLGYAANASFTFDTVKMIRWVSEEAFDGVRSVRAKRVMAFGYVTAPELYPKSLAAKYDEFIRKDASRMFPFCAWFNDFESYTTLVKYVRDSGRFSKVRTIGAIKRLNWLIDNDEMQSSPLYNTLAEYFTRRFPKAARECFQREAIVKEAAKHMKQLGLSPYRLWLPYDSTPMVTDQISQGIDRDVEKDDETYDEAYYYEANNEVTRVYSYNDDYLRYKSGVWRMRNRQPDKEELALVSEVESKFKVCVYHIHRCKVNDDKTLYSLLFISENENEWEHARHMTVRELPDCVALVYGYNTYEVSSLPVKTVDGFLFRTN